MTRRRLVALGWVATAVVPAGLATVLLVGCCALPFHRVLHRVAPLCHLATALLASHGDGAHEHPATPVRPGDEDAKRGSVEWRPAARMDVPLVLAASQGLRAAGVGPHSQIELGATRCDDDVGQRLALLETLRL